MKQILLIFIIMLATKMTAQPNQSVPCPPACMQKNPPTWCKCDGGDPLPIDDYLPLLALGGIIIGSYYVHMNRRALS